MYIHIKLFIIGFISNINCQMNWEKLFDTLSYRPNIKPAPRREAAIGYDISRNRVILFGGWQTSANSNNNKFSMPVLFDDTWEYSLDTRQWRPLSFSTNRPSARYGMLYTHNKYGLYISCGKGWLNDYSNDLWIYDFSEDQWRKMDQTFISIVPEARYSPVGGTYHSYEQLNIDKNNLYLSMGTAQFNMYDNVYQYTFTDIRSLNGIWDHIYDDMITGPFSFTHPHGRIHASSAMISPDELLIHGGCLSGGMSGGPCPSHDSWLYSYSRNKWDKVDTSAISPRMSGAMASLVSDGFRQSAVIFSGIEKDRTILKTELEKENEIGLYDSLGKRWIKKRVEGFYFPEKRDGHVMCTGKLNNSYGVFLFGGFGHYSDYNLADLWFLNINISYAFMNQNYMSYDQNAYNQKRSNYFSTIHLHSIFMFTGWFIFLNIGIMVSKYCKSKDECRLKLIRRIYRTLQIIGLILITCGIVFGFWSSHGIPHLAHLLIGLSAYILAVIQPISSFLRKQTKSKDYYIDEEEKMKALLYESSFIYNSIKLVHKNLNRTAFILAIVNSSLGVFYAVYEWYWVMVWFCILGGIICLYGLLEAKSYFGKSNLNETRKSEENGYEDCYDLTKSDSTQQLRPSSGSSSRTVENLPMQPTTRYTRNSLRINKSNNQLSPITPPPPYYNRNKNVASNLIADTGDQQQSPRQTQLSYSQQIKTSFNGANLDTAYRQSPQSNINESFRLSENDLDQQDDLTDETQKNTFYNKQSRNRSINESRNRY